MELRSGASSISGCVLAMSPFEPGDRRVAYRRNHGAELAPRQPLPGREIRVPSARKTSRGWKSPPMTRAKRGHGPGVRHCQPRGCHLNGGYLVFMVGIGPVHMDPHERVPRRMDDLHAKPDRRLFLGWFLSVHHLCRVPEHSVHLQPRGWLMRTVNKLALNAVGRWR